MTPRTFVADLHVHSKYSRATSQEMVLPQLAAWAKRKGIDLLGTGDFTHPLWLEELQRQLCDGPEGLFTHDGVAFMLTTEVSTVFYRQGEAKSVHHLLTAPSFAAAERINRALQSFGQLESDGRPTLNLDAESLVELVLAADHACAIIPAHAWTPWFSVFGSRGGFDTIEACYGRYAKEIFALETGLSSDPAMNWRLSALDRYALISNSDAHSPTRIGREANCWNCEMAYPAIMAALKTRDPQVLQGTIEFFPEEGKYHYDGHRKCGVRWSPAETRRHQGTCPECGRRVTVGVLHRVELLADRPEGFQPPGAMPFQHLVPLDEIVAGALGVGKDTVGVERLYLQLISRLGAELAILRERSPEELRAAAPAKVVEGILNARDGRAAITPGFDGEYGQVDLFLQPAGAATGQAQLELF